MAIVEKQPLLATKEDLGGLPNRYAIDMDSSLDDSVNYSTNKLR